MPRHEAVGRKLDEVLPTDLMTEISARASDERVSSLYKFPIRNRGGRNLVVNVSIAPLVGKSGDRIGRLILMDDITQRIRLEEQMVQNEKLTSLGLLAAGVAHEVNTPLAVISNYIQMLAKQLPSGDPRHQLIEKVVKQTFRASEIVNNLLNFSRTGAVEFTEVNLNSVVEETLSLIAHPFKTAHVQVTRNLQQELPPVSHSLEQRHGRNRNHRYRVRNSPRKSAPHLRSLLYHEVFWPRHRPGALGELRHHQGARREG